MLLERLVLLLLLLCWVVLVSGRKEDCPLLMREPLRDMYGELEPLASTHSSSGSGSSPPMSKVTWPLLALRRFMREPLEVRCSLSSEERFALATSPCERLRFSRLEWEVLLGRWPEELLRDDSLTSLVERRCAEAEDGLAPAAAAAAVLRE